MKAAFMVLCEILTSVFWVGFVFKPISKMAYGKSYKANNLLLSLFSVRATILAILDFLLIDHITSVFLGDSICMFVGAIIGVPFVAIFADNDIDSKNDKVISNNTTLRDRYSLGGYEHNRLNNDGDYSNRVTLSNHSKEGVYMNRDMNSAAKEICSFCGEEVESTYIYCPYCGHPVEGGNFTK